MRVNKAVFTAIQLNADSVLSHEFTVGPNGFVGLQVLIDNGAGDAPNDAPTGTWLIHASGGRRFTPLDGTTLTTELARVAAAGNTKIDKWAIIEGVPGSQFKLQYKAASGGAGSSRATVDVSTW